MVGIQRAYVAGLRDQIALEEGAVFFGRSVILIGLVKVLAD